MFVCEKKETNKGRCHVLHVIWHLSHVMCHLSPFPLIATDLRLLTPPLCLQTAVPRHFCFGEPAYLQKKVIYLCMEVVHGARHPSKILQDRYLVKLMAHRKISFVICYIAFMSRISFKKRMKRVHLCNICEKSFKTSTQFGSTLALRLSSKVAARRSRPTTASTDPRSYSISSLTTRRAFATSPCGANGEERKNKMCVQLQEGGRHPLNYQLEIYYLLFSYTKLCNVFFLIFFILQAMSVQANLT